MFVIIDISNLSPVYALILQSQCFTPSQLGLFLTSDHLMVKHSRLINFDFD